MKYKTKVKEVSRGKVSTEDAYNAFTDLTYFSGRFWLCYRTGKGHVSPHGKIVVRSSGSGDKWTHVQTLEQKDLDLRDPRLSVMDGKLYLLCFSLSYYKTKPVKKFHASDSFIYCLEEKKGKEPKFTLVHRFEYEKYKTTLWSFNKIKDTFYLGGYYFEGAKTTARIWLSKSILGPWDLHVQLQDDYLPSNLCFNEFDMCKTGPEKDGLFLFLRVGSWHFNRVKYWWNRIKERFKQKKIENTSKTKPYNHHGFCDRIVTASANYPFKDFEYKVHNIYLKGPRGIEHPNGTLFFVGRYKKNKKAPSKEREVALFIYDREKEMFEHLYTFAKGKDGSYAGLYVDKKDPGSLYVSFYSDHERLGTDKEGDVNDVWFSRLQLST